GGSRLVRDADFRRRLRPGAGVHRKRRALELPVRRVELALSLLAFSRRRMAVQLRLLPGLEEEHLDAAVGRAAELVLSFPFDGPALAAADAMLRVVHPSQRGAEPVQLAHFYLEELRQLRH